MSLVSCQTFGSERIKMSKTSDIILYHTLHAQAPKAATKGLDVAALGRGYASLSPGHALVLL